MALTLIGVFLVEGNAERWCPFGGVEAAYTYLEEGNLTCSLGVSNFYILFAVLLSALLLRRAFCGYACPVGALSEWLQKGAAALHLKPARIPRGLDAFLSLLKYAVLAVILYFTWTTAELVFRGYDPCYALISRHGEDITYFAYVICGAVALGSLFIHVPFCRWLCPLAAVLNPFSRFGLVKIQRSEGACVDCGKCAKTCPMAIPVDEVKTVAHARCTACLDCVDACPEGAEGALSSRWSRPAIAVSFIALLSGAVSASFLFPLPSFMWEREGEAVPAETAVLELGIENLTCRGTSNLLVYFLNREDVLMEIPGYLRLEAWPGPGFARTRITYDPARVKPIDIKRAITEPYFEDPMNALLAGSPRESPFVIEGYNPLEAE